MVEPHDNGGAQSSGAQPEYRAGSGFRPSAVAPQPVALPASLERRLESAAVDVFSVSTALRLSPSDTHLHALSMLTPCTRGIRQVSAVKVDPGHSCAELGRESIRCIEEHGYNRHAPECVPHFLAYKECKKLMTQERRKANKTLDML